MLTTFQHFEHTRSPEVLRLYAKKVSFSIVRTDSTWQPASTPCPKTEKIYPHPRLPKFPKNRRKIWNCFRKLTKTWKENTLRNFKFREEAICGPAS